MERTDKAWKWAKKNFPFEETPPPKYNRPALEVGVSFGGTCYIDVNGEDVLIDSKSALALRDWLHETFSGEGDKGGMRVSEIKGPHRAFRLDIKIGGDSWSDIESEIKFLFRHLLDHGIDCSSISGGPSSNHRVEIRIDENMTHEKYHKELEIYLKKLKETEPADVE